MINYMKQFILFLYDIWRSRELILELTKKDFQTRYLGSYLGIAWAFIQPVINITILWFVFEIGFKSVPVEGYPFILWLMAGILPWFFISESINSATSSIVENSYLVKKVVFRVSILPMVKLLSALFIHIVFILILCLMFWFYGISLTMYSLQLLYYLLAACILSLGISWITSALIIFLKDVGQIVSMALQLAFWVTPIFWSLKMVPVEYHAWLRLNPVYYVIEGYRNSLIYQQWFWEDPQLTLGFWLITGAIFTTGALVFRKLRPHFADVL